jgi:hypothetical protein
MTASTRDPKGEAGVPFAASLRVLSSDAALELG